MEVSANTRTPSPSDPIRLSDIEEIDRCARAYGWEVGQGKPMAPVIDASPNNPFLDKEWRKTGLVLWDILSIGDVGAKLQRSVDGTWVLATWNGPEYTELVLDKKHLKDLFNAIGNDIGAL